MKSKAILNVLYLLAGVGMDSAGRRRGAERLAAANGWFLRPLLYSVDRDGECRLHHSSGDLSVSAASEMWPREGGHWVVVKSSAP